jgi:hypothetical protein
MLKATLLRHPSFPPVNKVMEWFVVAAERAASVSRFGAYKVTARKVRVSSDRYAQEGQDCLFALCF